MTVAFATQGSTLQDLVEAAQAQLENTDGADGWTTADYLAVVILELLAETDPCGWDEPAVANDRSVPPSFFVEVPATWAARVSPDDARALARMLLRAADEADEENEKRAIRVTLALNKSNAPVE